MACFNLTYWCLYTEKRIDLRMSFFVKHNRCELIADHFKKGPLSIFFAVIINIKIFKCMQIALNTLFFYIHPSCKEKNFSQAKEKVNFGPDPVNTRTQKGGIAGHFL